MKVLDTNHTNVRLNSGLLVLVVFYIQNRLKYNKAGGKVLKGLDNRRKDEAALFNKQG
jgi:hypothetical protein